MRRARVDDNQSQIVEAVRRAGGVWIPTAGDPKIGFDGIIAKAGKVWIVEIKDGKKRNSQRRLTPAEAARKIQLEAVGVSYNVVESVEQALGLIGCL
jgi:hypothetical protein